MCFVHSKPSNVNAFTDNNREGTGKYICSFVMLCHIYEIHKSNLSPRILFEDMKWKVLFQPHFHFSTWLYGQSRYRFIGLCQQETPQETIVIKKYRCWKHLFTFPKLSLAQLWLANLSTTECFGVRCAVEPAGLSHNPSVWWLHQNVSFSINTRVSQRYELMMMKARWQPFTSVFERVEEWKTWNCCSFKIV